MATDDSLVEDMEDVLGGMDEADRDVGQDLPDEPPVEASAAAPALAAKAEAPVDFPNGFPNPLGISLTACHLPKAFSDDRLALSAYVRQHLDTRVIAQVSVSANERKLYAEYVKLTRPNRPLTPRWFAAAVRLIVQGKPLDQPEADRLETYAL